MQSSQYGILTYQANPQYNVGDYIQSLAAAQFLPQIDKYINREQLSRYNEDKIKMIMNGWFMHQPGHWPPSDKIDPLLVSFHLNSQAKDQLLNEEGKGWFKKHEPVGCRDPYTLKAMREANINAYMSGCLTTTFQHSSGQRTNDIYFVDVLFRVPDWENIIRTPRQLLKSLLTGDIFRSSQRGRILEKLFDDKLLNTAIPLQHYHTAKHNEKERFSMAENFLGKYATARLVVTSRLHCALPCLAFGTPVIFVDCGFSREYDKCRLEGIKDLFNTICIDDEGKVTSNFLLPGEKISGSTRIKNPELFREYVAPMRDTCRKFVKDER